LTKPVSKGIIRTSAYIDEIYPYPPHQNTRKKGERGEMAVRNAEAVWEGNLREGKGTVKLGSGAFEGAYSFASRFEEGTGTNPEELIGAAYAGCFSMALSADLERSGYTAKRIHTTAKVHLETVDGKPTITRIHIDTEAEVPGIDERDFLDQAKATKRGCPVARALTGVEIAMNAKLIA
jgi:osmotically inducible protein OsmC